MIKHSHVNHRACFFAIAVVIGLLNLATVGAASVVSEPLEISSGWKLQDAAKVAQDGAEISTTDFQAVGWYAATVPGTVLTSLVNDGVYPEPLYGENSRTNVIPETVELEFPASALRHWDVAGKRYVVEPGEFEIEVGASSGDIRATARAEIAD